MAMTVANADARYRRPGGPADRVDIGQVPEKIGAPVRQGKFAKIRKYFCSTIGLKAVVPGEAPVVAFRATGKHPHQPWSEHLNPAGLSHKRLTTQVESISWNCHNKTVFIYVYQSVIKFLINNLVFIGQFV